MIEAEIDLCVGERRKNYNNNNNDDADDVNVK